MYISNNFHVMIAGVDSYQRFLLCAYRQFGAQMDSSRYLWRKHSVL